MEHQRFKNIILAFIVIITACVAYYYVQRDKSIVAVWTRSAYTVDSIYASVDEKRIARRFSDSTLPNLQKTGLITSTHRHEWEMVISVDSILWNDRSPFFKNSFLDELLMFSKVQGSTFSTSIIDAKNGYVYAKVIPPDHKALY